MREALQRIFSFIYKRTGTPQRSSARKSKGQSMVEFAILLPILIILFSGMVEFGFMLNSYLSLLDATRQAARFCSNGQPFLSVDTSTDPVTYEDDLTFSPNCAQIVVDTLAPPEDPNARQIVMNPLRDDVIVSVISISVDTSEDPDVISAIDRFPVGTSFYSLYENEFSAYSDENIGEFMIQNGAEPVETGILIVEVYYGYVGILRLPWLTMFMSPDDPVMLHASTIMPLVAAKP